MAKHENLKALFTAIATAIRNKTGGTDAIIADDFPEAIDGIQTGGGMDKIQKLIELNNGSAGHLFAWLNVTSVDELLDGVDTSNITDMSSMFYRSKYLSTVPLFDTSKTTDMGYMFSGCLNLTAVPLFDTSNVTDMSGMFQNCSKLTSIPALDMFRVGSASFMFDNCEAMTECWVRNIKTPFTVGSGTSYGHLLTLESLLHLCKECFDVSSSSWQPYFQVGSANLAKLANVYVKLIPITDDMRAEDNYIDNKHPFTVCESTDEGAMLIADYMSMKGWQFS